MRALAVKLHAYTFSVRKRLDHTYQKALPLPPPTTMHGLAGAALGIGRNELYKPESPIRSIKCQVLADNEPEFAKDLMLIDKIKLADFKQKGKPEKSPYFREVLANCRFTILYAASEQLLQELRDAFSSPAHALVLGRAEDLARVESVELVECEELDANEVEFMGTILRYNRAAIQSVKNANSRFPIPIEKWPSYFEIGKNGERIPSDTKSYAFVPYNTYVTIRTDVFEDKIFSYQSRAFIWI